MGSLFLRVLYVYINNLLAAILLFCDDQKYPVFLHKFQCHVLVVDIGSLLLLTSFFEVKNCRWELYFCFNAAVWCIQFGELYWKSFYCINGFSSRSRYRNSKNILSAPTRVVHKPIPSRHWTRQVQRNNHFGPLGGTSFIDQFRRMRFVFLD